MFVVVAFGCDVNKTFDNSQNSSPTISSVGSLITVVSGGLQLKVNVGTSLGSNAYIEFNDANSADNFQVTVGTPVSATGGVNTTNDGLTITGEGTTISRQYSDTPTKISITGALAKAGSETVTFTLNDNVNASSQVVLTIVSVEPPDNPVLAFGVNTATSSPTVTEIAAGANLRNYTVSVPFGNALNVNFSGDGDITANIGGVVQVDPSFNDNSFYPGTYNLGSAGAGSNHFNLSFNGAALGASGTTHNFNLAVRNFSFNLASTSLPQPPAGSTTPGQFKILITLTQTQVVAAVQSVSLLVTVQPPPPTPDVILIGTTAWSQVGASFDSSYNGWKNPAALSFTTVFSSALPGNLSLTLPRTDPTSVPKINKLTMRLTLDTQRSSPGYVSNQLTGLSFSGGTVSASEITGTGTGEQNTVQITIGGTPAFSGYLVYQVDAWGEDSNGVLVGTRLRSDVTIRIFDTPAAFFYTSYLGYKLRTVFSSDDGSGRDAQSWIGGDTNINAATTAQTITTAFASGGSWFTAKGSALVVGDFVRITNTTDFTGGNLVSAKGSALASGDRFRILNVTSGQEAIVFDGTGQTVITHVVDSLVRTPIEINQTGLTGTGVIKLVGATRESASGKWESVSVAGTTGTFTDSDANWPSNYWVGVRIQPNVSKPRIFTITANTATTITVVSETAGELTPVFDTNSDSTISALEAQTSYVTFGRQQNSATPSTDTWDAVIDDIASTRTILFDDTAPFTEDNAQFDFQLLPIQSDSKGREYPVASNYNAKTITGTVSTTANSTNVDGVGTRFQVELQVGDMLQIGTTVRKVAIISSNTNLTLDGGAIATTATVKAAKFQVRALRGTVSVDPSSTSVTGANTVLTSEGLSAGDAIIIAGQLCRISSVGSATSLTLTANHTNGATGVTAFLPVARNTTTITSGTGAPTFNVSSVAGLAVNDVIIVGNEVHTVTAVGASSIDVSPNHVGTDSTSKIYRFGKTYTVLGRLTTLASPVPAAGTAYVVGGRKPVTVVALVDTDSDKSNGGETVLISLDADKDTATWTAATFSPALNNNSANDHIFDIYIDRNKSSKLPGFEYVALVADVNSNAARSVRTMKLSSAQGGSLQFSGTSFFTASDLASNGNLVVYDGKWTSITSGANSTLEDSGQQWVDDELNNYFLMPDVSQSTLMVQITDTFAPTGAQRSQVQITGFNASTNNVAVGDYYRVIGLPKYGGVQVKVTGLSPTTFEPLTSATGIQNGWMVVKFDNGRHQLYRTVNDRNSAGVETTWSNYWVQVQGAFLLSNQSMNDFKFIKSGGTRSSDIWMMALDEALPTIFQFVPAGDPFKGALNRLSQFPATTTDAGTGAVNQLAPVPGAPQTVYVAADSSNLYRDDSAGSEVFTRIVSQLPPDFAAGVDFVGSAFASNSYGLVIASSNRYCRFGGRDENIRPDVFIQDVRSPNPGTTTTVTLAGFGHPPITFGVGSAIRDPQNPTTQQYQGTSSVPFYDTLHSSRTSSGGNWFNGSGFDGFNDKTLGELSSASIKWNGDWDPFVFDNEMMNRQLSPPVGTAWLGNLYAPRILVSSPTNGNTFNGAGSVLTRTDATTDCTTFVRAGDYVEADRVVYQVASVTATTITVTGSLHAGFVNGLGVYRVAPWRLGQIGALRDVTVSNGGAGGVCTLAIGSGTFVNEVAVGDLVEVPLKGSSPLKSTYFRVTTVAAQLLTLDHACPTPSGVSLPFTLLQASSEFAYSHGHVPVWSLQVSVATHGSGSTPANTKEFASAAADNTNNDSIFILNPRGVQRVDFSGAWKLPRGWAIESSTSTYPNGQRAGWVHSSQSPPVVTDVDSEIGSDGRKRRRAPLIGASSADGYLVVDSDAFFSGATGDLGNIDSSLYSPVIDATVGNDGKATISFRYRNYHLGQEFSIEARRWIVTVDDNTAPLTSGAAWSDWIAVKTLNTTVLDWTSVSQTVDFDNIPDFIPTGTRSWQIFDTGSLVSPATTNHLRDAKYVQFRIRFKESTWAGWALIDDVAIDPN